VTLHKGAKRAPDRTRDGRHRQRGTPAQLGSSKTIFCFTIPD
jgi:hypothetical protein